MRSARRRAGETSGAPVRRNLVVGAVVGGMVAAAGIGWALGAQIRSPAELAAAAAPPAASNITVEVVRQVLSADVITRGDVVYDEPVQVSLSGSFANQPEQLVVTNAAAVEMLKVDAPSPPVPQVSTARSGARTGTTRSRMA